MSASLRSGSPPESVATVSVVVCFYNAEAYLSQAIESVARQTHPRWELILVDDGSTDGGTRIARAAADGDPARVRYAEHPDHENRGKSTSRNLGLSLARGDYVVFLDADDVLLPHKLAHQAAILDADAHTDAVYGRTLYWHDAAPGRRDRISRLWVPWNRVHEPPALFIRFLRRPGSVPCLCAIMARRDVVLRLGGYDESIQDLYEDQVLISKLALNCRIRVDLSCGEKYRQHAGSSSSQAVRDATYHPWRPNPARRAYLVWLRRYVAEQSPRTRDAVDPALRRAWRPYMHPDAYRLIARPTHEWESVRDRVLRRLRPEPLDLAACGSEGA